MRNYLGWDIYGSGDRWYAVKFGVRMSASSEAQIIRMLDNAKDDGRNVTSTRVP